MSILDKFRFGLKRTRQGKLSSISRFFTRHKLDENELEELEEALLEADIGVVAVDDIIDELRESVRTTGRKDELNIRELIHRGLLDRLNQRSETPLTRFSTKPWVILLVGVNGSGKTTTAGKLAYKFSQEGKKVVIAAADTFRAAAVEQVELWAQLSGARLVKQSSAADPAAVTFDSYKSALARNDDVLIIDTAGRLQSKKNLMNELEKITRVLKKINPAAPHESLLVIDATTGQNGLSQARAFIESASVTGLVLTKLDGTARGGIAVPISSELKLPMEFVGLGEGIEDLHSFDPDAFIGALLN